MKTKEAVNHTEGPWNVGKTVNDNGDLKISCEAYDIVAIASGDFSEEIMANARLIAAAPELLEAAKLIMTHFIGDRNSENCLDESGISADKLRAAISKAEGR